MHTLNSRKRKSEYLKMLKRNNLLEQVKPKLKEIFYSIDKSEVSTQLVPQIKEALQLLNLSNFASKIEGFEDQFTKVKESMAEDELSFEDFTNIFFNVLDMMDNQDNPKEHVMFDFLDPSIFVYASNSKIINKDFSAKILDESIILRKRIDMNYSIGGNVDKNIKILKAIENDCIKNYSDSPYLDSFLKHSYSLRDCWTWVGKCIEQKGASNNLTRGLRDVLGSLFGTKASLNNHVEKIYLTQYRVYSNQERQEALSSLGWSYIFDPSSKPHQHANISSDLEEAYSRNAALSVFNFDFGKAFQSLANIQSSSNEIAFMKSILQLLKDWYNGIQPEKDMRIVFSCDTSRFYDEYDENENQAEDFSNEVLYRRQKPSKYDAAIKELKVIQTLCQHLNPIDPYFRAICKFIANKERLSHIIKDHGLSFLDRIAFAYRFLGPKSLHAFLNETIEEAKENGYLGALFLVGKNPTGFEIIQKYIDKTADVQSIALLGVYFRLFKFPNEDMFKGFLLDYKDILNKLMRWEDRIRLEKNIHDLEKSFVYSVKDRKSSDQAPLQMNHVNDVRCYFCNGQISKVSPLNLPGENRMTIAQMYKNKTVNTNVCSQCSKPLPNCAICLLPVSVLNPYIEQQEKTNRITPKKENTAIDQEESLIWCQQCKHGGHFAHIDEWFLNHTKCPVSGCVCECMHDLL